MQDLPNAVSASRDESAEDVIQLGETMWEACLLLGVKELGTVHSIIGLIALLMNMLAQLAFTVIVVDLRVDDRVTDETAKAYQFWRLNIAHRIHGPDQGSVPRGSSLLWR